MDILEYHNIYYLINASISLVKGGRLGLMPGFCSTLAALVSVIPVLCSLILHPLRGWVLWEPLDSLLGIKLLQQGPTLVLTFAT